ncbi:hypothetical protein ACQY1M_25115 (plasmid) [Neorhizobium sp. DAR64861/K0K2]|uniref:hypothetical protein n=1 Tax=Neorhizobium sp. DAR64861/K0K2 TaxID=3421956 RepID=UPI003D273A21
MQMLLIMFYAEELKRQVLDLIQTTDRIRVQLKPAEFEERVPKGAKKSLPKALNVLIDDGAINDDEKNEIVSLIDYRNIIGHRMHELVSDISTESFARTLSQFGSDRAKAFDYEAVERLQHFRNKLGNLYKTHHYASTISMNSLLFESAERTFLAEIKALRRKIRKLAQARKTDINVLNAEIQQHNSISEANNHPRHPLHQYDNKKLTHRGVEFCYQLFDIGRSPMAVAHLMGMSLHAARKRRKTWEVAGGASRQIVDMDSLPRRKFYRKHDD